jgi:hypothetical protein
MVDTVPFQHARSRTAGARADQLPRVPGFRDEIG